MYYDLESADKLRVAYLDHETSDIVTDQYGNTEEMQERSSCVLINTVFKMSLKDEFMEYLNVMFDRKRRKTL